MTALAGDTANRPAGLRARLSDRLRLWRDRLVGDPAFQRFSAAFPLTRPVARRHASALFDLCAGFVYSQVLFACVRVRLFDHLADGPLDIDDLSARTGLAPAAVRRLAKAGIALQLLEWRGDTIGLGMLGAALRGNPGAVAMIEHHAMLYADLGDPVALLRGDAPRSRLRQFWAYGPDGGSLAPDGSASAYTDLMATSQSLVGDDILDAYPVAGHRVILDIGGGDGTFLRAVHRRAPQARLILFDLPQVAAIAASRRDRPESLTIEGGDFLVDSLPEGADLVTLVRVVHDHDDPAVLALLGRIHAAMAPGGTLMIAEPMAGEASVAPMADAYFGFYLMAMGSGEARSPEALGRLLGQAGFHHIRSHRTRRPLFTGVVTARRDSGA